MDEQRREALRAERAARSATQSTPAVLESVETSLATLSTRVDSSLRAQTETTTAVETLATSLSSDGALPRSLAALIEGNRELAETLASMTEAVEALNQRAASFDNGLSPAQLTVLTETVTASVTDSVAAAVAKTPPQVKFDMSKLPSGGFRDQVISASEVHAQAVVAQVKAATEALDRAEKTANRLRVNLTWGGIGRVAAAVTPVALLLFFAAVLMVPVAQILGIASLTDWAWSSFSGAGAWWSKSLIAIGTLTFIGGLGYGLFRVNEALTRLYKGF